MMEKSSKMIETLANGYSYDSARQELSNEYQHDRVKMIFTIFCFFVHWTEVTSASERLRMPHDHHCSPDQQALYHNSSLVLNKWVFNYYEPYGTRTAYDTLWETRTRNALVTGPWGEVVIRLIFPRGTVIIRK